MYATRTLLLTFFTVFALGVFGQSFYPPIVNYSSKVYGKERNPENYCVVQDQRGVMYFGNSNGVLEYDGTNWNFIKTVPGTYVRSMAIDSTGTIYVGTYMDFGYLYCLRYLKMTSTLVQYGQFMPMMSRCSFNVMNRFLFMT